MSAAFVRGLYIGDHAKNNRFLLQQDRVRRRNSTATLANPIASRYELTKYQANQLRALGRALWPEQNLPRDEVCRRLLLNGADRMRVTNDGDQLLEEVCQPSQRAIES